MERNSAACAMEWSIELEKALRSKRPGQSALAILQFGPRLQQWNREPESNLAVHHMFDLIPREDQLFANVIFLRLADAFQWGDEHIRRCVVKVFFLEYKQRDEQKRGTYRGWLSKNRVLNHLDLLNRVRFVFDNGDVESKALALILFGCWAPFSKDSAHIRYIVLSCLVSSQVLEVKAALFAAGCFCELSDDFSRVVLEMLNNIMIASETSPSIKCAGARVFAKMGCSYSVAHRAYKAGKKLVLDSTDEDYWVAMLVSLSKLISLSTALVSEQVDFLFSIFSQRQSLRVQETALKCLHFIFSRGMVQFPITVDLSKLLFNIVGIPELPLSMQCDVLQILRKILLDMLPDLPVEIIGFDKLSTIAGNASSNSLLAIHILVHISGKVKQRRESESESDICFSSPMPSELISFIINRITLLVKPFFDLYEVESLVHGEVTSLFNLLLCMVEKHPDLIGELLDKVYVLIRSLSDENDTVMATEQTETSVNDLMETKGVGSVVTRLKLAHKIYRFLATFIENLKEAGHITLLVLNKLKLMVEHICNCNLFDCYTRTIYSLLLHYRVIWNQNFDGGKKNCHVQSVTDVSLANNLVKHEVITIEFSKKMLSENHNWAAYKIGTYSACQGAWFPASFIFQQLTTKVHSDFCVGWLKSLLHFAHSEREIQMLLYAKQGSNLVDWSETEIFLPNFKNDLCKIGHDSADNLIEPNYSEGLASAYKGICSAKETLEIACKSGHEFHFQKWLLSLRAKLVAAVMDTFKALETIPLVGEDIGNSGQVDKSYMITFLTVLQEITRISLQLKSLAKEFDLVISSFIDMDSKSSKIISALALSSSLLAFITSFALFVPNLPETFRTWSFENFSCSSRAHLVQNLAGRLWHLDLETSSNLCELLETNEECGNCFHLQSRNQLYVGGAEARDILNICSYTVSGVCHLKSEAKKACNEEAMSRLIKNGLQLLSNTLLNWMQVSFRSPKYFFRLRRCIGSELFAVSDDKNPDNMYVLQGSHLSSCLCLQLKNVPSYLSVRLRKLYCILYCRVTLQESIQCMSMGGYEAWETDEMVEMNEKLFQYVTESSTKKTKRIMSNNNGGSANTFVCFEPNEKGQGFSRCLIDVSGFPVGSYRIKWHSCCIDSRGNYWSLLPLNAGPIFNVQESVIEV